MATIAKLDQAIFALRAASAFGKAAAAEKVIGIARDIIASQDVAIDNLQFRVGRLEGARTGGPAEREHRHGEG